MEYVQITLNDWLNLKEQLRKDLYEAQATFVRIGYALRRIEDEKLYLQDGYSSVAEFAKAEYGLDKTATSRFISINRKYSVDGYSDRLIPEYARFGQSKLSEMLSLPDKDMELLQPEVTRENIRELKQFNKITPEPAAVDDLVCVIENMFKDNRDLLNEMCSSVEYAENNVKKLAEMVNPSGNRSYRNGIFFLMMYDSGIKIKQFGHSELRTMSWGEFFDIVHTLFDADAGPDTWENHFGEGNKMEEEEQLPGQMSVEDYPEMMPGTTENVSKPEEDGCGHRDMAGKCEVLSDKEVKESCVEGPCPEETPAAEEIVEIVEEKPGLVALEKPVAPAQQFLENQEPKVIPGEDNVAEEIGETAAACMTRAEYMATLEITRRAFYMSVCMEMLDDLEPVKKANFWNLWLKAKVNKWGKEIKQE